MMNIPYFYYGGDARDPNVQEAIKGKFHSLLTSYFVPPFFCLSNRECAKANMSVSPGIMVNTCYTVLIIGFLVYTTEGNLKSPIHLLESLIDLFLTRFHFHVRL